MTVNYFILETENDLRKIFVRLKDGKRLDRKAWTEKFVHVKYWNNNKQRVKEKPLIISETPDNVSEAINESPIQINSYLADLKHYIISMYNEDFAKSLTIEKDWLKTQIKNFSNRVEFTEMQSKDYFFSNWIDNYINDPKNLLNKNGKPLSEATIKTYKSVYNKLLAFENYHKKHYRFEDLSHNDFYKSIIYFLREIDKLNENTIGKHISTLKTFIAIIKDEGYPVNLDFEKKNKFSGVSESTLEYYLDEREIDKIFKLDLSKNERLDNVRDLFIIGLWTGLRISDFKRLDIGNIKDGIISITTQKTKKRVAIGMHPQLKAVLKKRDGQFPKKISDQKFNEYVKEVVKLAEIIEPLEGAKLSAVKDPETGKTVQRKIKAIYPKYELISSHTCRRSFATNLYKTKALPLVTLMSLTGHKTESQFIEYIKIGVEENAVLMNDYYANKLGRKNLIAPLKIV